MRAEPVYWTIETATRLLAHSLCIAPSAVAYEMSNAVYNAGLVVGLGRLGCERDDAIESRARAQWENASPADALRPNDRHAQRPVDEDVHAIALHPKIDGECLRGWRISERLSLGEAARLAGVSTVELSEMERGKRPFDLRSVVERIKACAKA